MTGPIRRRSMLKGIAGAAAVSGATTVGLAGPASAETGTDPQAGNPSAVRMPAAAPADRRFDGKVEALLRRMTVAEKFGQLQQLTYSGGFGPGAAQASEVGKLAAQGVLGSVLDINDVATINGLQKIAVEQSRLKIPLVFGLDIIHGYLTTFPIPLAQASSFDPEVAAVEARTAAAEARAGALHWTFAPMVDVSHEPRWGRVAEGGGEDPYLTSRFAVAKTQGFQGEDLAAPTSLAACAKHFVAYGQPEGGREYNTVDLSEQRLRNMYLETFRAAVNAGVATVMASFNTIGGIPGHANHHTLTDVLRREWGFAGMVVSDYEGVKELIAHAVAEDGADAGRLALNAGVDMEMVSTELAQYGQRLLDGGAVTMQRLDEAVANVLRLKYRLGLFDNPYTDPGREVTAPAPASRAAARSAAARCTVLLKNSGVLPLGTSARSIAVVGPFADSTDLLGNSPGPSPHAGGFPAVTVAQGIRAAAPGAHVTVAPGVDATNPDTSGIAAAVRAAQAADVVVAVLGEPGSMSGEASSRADIGLPGAQPQLLAALRGTGKPLVVVLVNGRPLTIEDVDAAAAAVLEAWHPGIEGGNAIADVLFGAVNPGGKLPASFPRTVGQVPTTYYNHESTGRPYDPSDPDNKWVSRYLDVPNSPLYPFGHGLSYTTFAIDGPVLNTSGIGATQIRGGATVTVTATVRNTGQRAGDEVVQLYVHDVAAMIAQPVRRLRGFQRVTLAPGQARTVSFTLAAEDLGYWTNDYRGEFVVEPGRFDIYVGGDSTTGQSQSLRLT
jgi:beta-glucosidase